MTRSGGFLAEPTNIGTRVRNEFTALPEEAFNVRMDVTLQGSPFGQYGNLAQSSLNGIFLSRAELNYRPSHDFMISLQYQRNPYSRFGWYDSPFSDHRWGEE